MITYTGNGQFVQGVPARDLTKDEWSAISKTKQKSLLKLGIFAKPKVERKYKPKEDVEPVVDVEE